MELGTGKKRLAGRMNLENDFLIAIFLDLRAPLGKALPRGVNSFDHRHPCGIPVLAIDQSERLVPSAAWHDGSNKKEAGQYIGILVEVTPRECLTERKPRILQFIFSQRFKGHEIPNVHQGQELWLDSLDSAQRPHSPAVQPQSRSKKPFLR